MENMKNQNSYLKQQDLLEHAKNPKNYGLLVVYDFISGEHNPSCGDSITICGLVNNGVVCDIRFEGKGCVLSLAMASMLTDFVKGRSLRDILALDQDIVTQLLGIELGPNRVQCGLLPVRALRAGIASYDKSLNS